MSAPAARSSSALEPPVVTATHTLPFSRAQCTSRTVSPTTITSSGAIAVASWASCDLHQAGAVLGHVAPCRHFEPVGIDAGRAQLDRAGLA